MDAELLDNPRGWEHVDKIIQTKLRLQGKSHEEIASLSPDEIRRFSSLFGGAHELVIAGRHLRPGAVIDNEYYSSGEMTNKDHFGHAIYH